MSKEIKHWIKEAKSTFSEKDCKVVEEKCQNVLKEEPNNYHANILLGAIFQDSNPAQAAKYLYKATECSGDTSVAFNGLLKCVPPSELPEVCENYLQKVPTNYEKIHRHIVTNSANMSPY